MFLPSRTIAPPFPIQEYADPAQQALFEQQTRYAAGLAGTVQPGRVNLAAPIPFCGQIPIPSALNWSANFVSPPQSADTNPPYGTPKGSTIFSWIVNAAKQLPITPSDAGA